jgi:hypothetical protein
MKTRRTKKKAQAEILRLFYEAKKKVPINL